jgi:putative DNA primase/helicase
MPLRSRPARSRGGGSNGFLVIAPTFRQGKPTPYTATTAPTAVLLPPLEEIGIQPLNPGPAARTPSTRKTARALSYAPAVAGPIDLNTLYQNPDSEHWFERELPARQIELAISMLQAVPRRGVPDQSGTYTHAFQALAALVGWRGPAEALSIVSLASWDSQYWDVADKAADIARDPRSGIGALIKLARDHYGWKHPDEERIEASRAKRARRHAPPPTSPNGETTTHTTTPQLMTATPPSQTQIPGNENGNGNGNGRIETEPWLEASDLEAPAAEPSPPAGRQDDTDNDDINNRRRDDRPVELQAGDILYALAQGRYAVRADTVHAYDPEQGIWVRHPDAVIARAAQAVLRQLYVVKRDKNTDQEWQENPHGSAAEVRNTIASLRVTAGHGPFISDAPPPVIVFTNGTYHLSDGQLRPHSPDNGATYRIAAPFVSAVDCPEELRRFAWTCFPDGALEILRAYIRWVIDPSIPYGQLFHFVGPSGSGKGTAIDLAQSLLPPSLVRSIGHPALLENGEKVYQYAHGGRLICFPDCPVRLRQQGHLGNFYEMVENKLQSIRRLHGADSTTVQLFARVVVGSIGPLQLGDGADGFLRRVLTLQTLPRQGEPDPTLRAALIGTTPRHQQLRGELCAWALAMAAEDVERILSRDDTEGLLRAGAEVAAKGSDTVTLFIDEALIPHPLGPNAVVADYDLGQMFEAYLGWCRCSNVQHGMQKANFIGALRQALGPARCLPRANGPRGQQRVKLPRFDAGFTLRPGLLGSPDPDFNPSHIGDRTTFDRLKLGSGGLEAIADLPPARRPEDTEKPPLQLCLQPTDSPVSTSPDSPVSTPESSDPLPEAQAGGGGDSPVSTSRRQGGDRAGDRAETGLPESLTSPANVGISANQEGWRQGYTPTYPLVEKNTPPEASAESVFRYEGNREATALSPPCTTPTAAWREPLLAHTAAVADGESDIPYESPERLADMREERIPQHIREQRDADRLWEQQHLGRPPEPEPTLPRGPTAPWLEPLLALAATEPGLTPNAYGDRLYRLHRLDVPSRFIAAVLKGDLTVALADDAAA